MPIERYIVNFVLETPLPPQGKIQVSLALPRNVVQITRPPQNQLPMIDFSFRPLFTLLSIDNILVVFKCLLAECTVCVLSENIAILTPVLEALLILLFPFSWQGLCLNRFLLSNIYMVNFIVYLFRFLQAATFQ